MTTRAFLTALLWIWDGTDVLLWWAGWIASLVLAAAWAICPAPPRLPEAPEDHQLPPVNEPRREWRFYAGPGVCCSGCSEQTRAGWYAPWWYDSRHGWFQSSDERYCAACADLREQAESLGPEGVKEAWIEGKLTSERRDAMLDHLVREESPD